MSEISDLKSEDKHVALQNLSIYYTRENIRKQYKNTSLKILAPTWNDEFELSDAIYSFLQIQDYTQYITNLIWVNWSIFIPPLLV